MTMLIKMIKNFGQYSAPIMWATFLCGQSEYRFIFKGVPGRGCIGMHYITNFRSWRGHPRWKSDAYNQRGVEDFGKGVYIKRWGLGSRRNAREGRELAINWHYASSISRQLVNQRSSKKQICLPKSTTKQRLLNINVSTLLKYYTKRLQITTEIEAFVINFS